jgi:tRNA pseudouridine55 synthase
MDGILNIDKPSGITSHDVVQQVRRLLGEKRVGHTGTLDPSATGVLVLCVGKATRIAQYLEAGEKEYHAVMQIGVITDTLDADGHVLETRSYAAPDLPRVLQFLKEFTGPIMQRPPAYSAIKVGGVPSYKLARQGKAEPLKPRAVTIHCLDLKDYADPFLSLRIGCSKGVYIRTLCADIGEALGMGAHMTKLVRTRSGRFRIEQAVTLDQLALMSRKEMGGIMVTMNDALDDIPAINVNEDDSRKIAHGMRIELPIAQIPGQENILVRIHNENMLVALGRAGQGFLKPETVF